MKNQQKKQLYFVWIEPLWNWNLYKLCISTGWQNRLNWTFMELKYLLGQLGSAAIGVWIEPLWNWNADAYVSFKVANSLNWTFMELKLRFALCTNDLMNGLNWTFMELKSYFPAIVGFFATVWIEPLWNWNITFVEVRALPTCLNWTFMELKFQWLDDVATAMERLNWTFMELKWRHRSVSYSRRQRLNWTFMELKWVVGWKYAAGSGVWIEPLWNWNVTKSWPVLYSKACLNWTFMELKFLY